MSEGDFEFERKFYVSALPPSVLAEPQPAGILQSYFLAADGYAIRVRLQASQLPPAMASTNGPSGLDERELLEAWAPHFDFCALTAKGPYVGGTRYEAERELDVAAGLAMVRLGGDLVAKLRYAVWLGADGWVVDSFFGRNEGLIIAEVERGGPVVDLVIPPFCVTEVTDDPRFANDELAHSPFTHWSARFAAQLAAAGPRFLTSFGHNELSTSL